MSLNINKIIKLIGKSDDNFIFEQDGKEFIIMNLEKYSQMIGNKEEKNSASDLSEQQLIDRINQDIASFQENSANQVDIEELPKNSENLAVEDSVSGADEQYYLEPVD